MKKYIRKCYFYAAWLFSKLVLILPYKFTVGFLSNFLGGLAYYVVGDARNKARKHLTMCFPEKSQEEITKIIKTIFKYEAKNFFELLNFPKMSSEFFDSIAIMEQEQKDLFNKLLERKKGILALSGHIGNWEMLAAGVAKHYPLNVIARKIYIEELNNMLVHYRNIKQVKVILRSELSSARKMLKALRNNEIIAMLIDQDTSVQSVFVDFFGRPASTPLGLASIALKVGSPVILAVDKRLPNGKHKFVISDEIVPPESTGDFDTDVKNFTAKLTKKLEDFIRENPEQWVWFHERWKTKQK
ncbi:MAG: lysophospholipid acyltransferase family protein [Elusimicrobia bacterium]|jgi:KDO2-lipid IV(A) lauroyltransferase|nr:lysophospholipid acyltransferase family protein [Elusimicrobiota bacterium]MBR4632698.1 lysophospholipid acyltransferase family protein [Elusimicrobiota bacterium]